MIQTDLLGYVHAHGVLCRVSGDGKLSVKPISGTVSPEMQAFIGSKTRLIVGDYRAHSKRLSERLSTTGWALMHSAVLGCRIAVIRDDSVVLPDAYSSLPKYTLAELRNVAGASPDELRRLHEIKVMSGGVVASCERLAS